jgi:hypothetical protein
LIFYCELVKVFGESVMPSSLIRTAHGTHIQVQDIPNMINVFCSEIETGFR